MAVSAQNILHSYLYVRIYQYEMSFIYSPVTDGIKYNSYLYSSRLYAQYIRVPRHFLSDRSPNTPNSRKTKAPQSSSGGGCCADYSFGSWLGPSLWGNPEKMPELPFLKPACVNYCFRAYLAYLSPGTRQAASFCLRLFVRHSISRNTTTWN